MLPRMLNYVLEVLNVMKYVEKYELVPQKQKSVKLLFLKIAILDKESLFNDFVLTVIVL